MAEEQQNPLGKVGDVLYDGRVNRKNCYFYEQSDSGFGAVSYDDCFVSCCKPNNITITGDQPQKMHLDILAKKEFSNLYHNHNTFIKLGSDPEVFAVDEHGVVIPAFEFCPAKDERKSKKLANELGASPDYYGKNMPHKWFANPQEIPNSYLICRPFWDGFQAEFNTRAHTCLEGVVTDVGQGLNNTQKALLEKFPNAKLVSDNLVEIPEAFLQMASEKHVQFGCSPSLNAYGEVPMAIANGREVNVRAAGMHVHFGIEDCPGKPELVRLLDASMGIASVALFGKEENVRRREMYGRAGEYRTPAHGLEYRVMSSAMLDDPYRIHLLVDMGRFVMRLAMAGLMKAGRVEYFVDEPTSRMAINEGNVEVARGLLERNKKFWRSFFKGSYGNDKIAWRWLMEGHKKSGSLSENWIYDGFSGIGAVKTIAHLK